VLKADQSPNDVLWAEKLSRDNRRSLFFVVLFAAFTFFGTPNRGSAAMTAFSGIMLLVEAYGLEVSARIFKQVGRPKPAWLDLGRTFALLSGLGVLATGIWLFLRR
jgi:hypothetical protein